MSRLGGVASAASASVFCFYQSLNGLKLQLGLTCTRQTAAKQLHVDLSFFLPFFFSFICVTVCFFPCFILCNKLCSVNEVKRNKKETCQTATFIEYISHFSLSETPYYSTCGCKCHSSAHYPVCFWL